MLFLIPSVQRDAPGWYLKSLSVVSHQPTTLWIPDILWRIPFIAFLIYMFLSIYFLYIMFYTFLFWISRLYFNNFIDFSEYFLCIFIKFSLIIYFSVPFTTCICIIVRMTIEHQPDIMLLYSTGNAYIHNELFNNICELKNTSWQAHRVFSFCLWHYILWKGIINCNL